MSNGPNLHCDFSARQMGIKLMRNTQQGTALVVSLIMLIVITFLGTSAAQISLEEDKASRNDRDHQIAFQAAEAALIDAELDIENSPDKEKSRSHIFSKKSALGFPDDGEAGCRTDDTIYLGLCRHSIGVTKAAWLTANFLNDSPSVVDTVPYGKFTGKTLQIGKGTLPGKPPRYVIELLVFNQSGENADQVSYFYRVTAMGFGARDSSQVVLQTFYRKEG